MDVTDGLGTKYVPPPSAKNKKDVQLFSVRVAE